MRTTAEEKTNCFDEAHEILENLPKAEPFQSFAKLAFVAAITYLIEQSTTSDLLNLMEQFVQYTDEQLTTIQILTSN